MLAEVLHGLTEHAVVHELVEVLLKVAGGLLPEFSVHVDVGLHPWALVKAECSLNLLQLHTQGEIELQLEVVQHILLRRLGTSFSTSALAPFTPRSLC